MATFSLAKIEGQIQTATMLIGLGLATAEKIKGFFQADASLDDAALAAIMAEVDQRIARRS